MTINGIDERAFQFLRGSAPAPRSGWGRRSSQHLLDESRQLARMLARIVITTNQRGLE